jgi:hypothetical protein
MFRGRGHQCQCALPLAPAANSRQSLLPTRFAFPFAIASPANAGLVVSLAPRRASPRTRSPLAEFRVAYKEAVEACGSILAPGYTDEGENRYYDAINPSRPADAGL